jgi:hypothetical protein
MSTSRRIVFVVAVIAFGFLVALTGPTASERKISLLFRGFQFKKQNGVYAVFELTNATRRAITYSGSSDGPDWKWLTATGQGWKRGSILYMGAGDLPRPRTLSPSSGVVFGCWVEPDLKPSKIEVTYSDGRSTNGVWRFLPRSIARRLPWLKDSYTLETPVFSLRG